MPTISETITLAKKAQYLADVAAAKFPTMVSEKVAKRIYLTRASVEFAYDLDANPDFTAEEAIEWDRQLQLNADYLYFLIGAFVFEAEAVSGQGAGAPVVTIPPDPPPYDFEVSASSFIIAGQSAKTINAFVGRNIIFVRNGVAQNTTEIPGGSYFYWNPNSGQFACYPEASTGELFLIQVT